MIITTRSNPVVVVWYLEKNNKAFPGESINLGGWQNLSGQNKNSGQLMWADKIIYVGE